MSVKTFCLFLLVVAVCLAILLGVSAIYRGHHDDRKIRTESAMTAITFGLLLAFNYDSKNWHDTSELREVAGRAIEVTKLSPSHPEYFGLVLGDLLKGDAWGNPYWIKLTIENDAFTSFDLISCGPDGRFNGKVKDDIVIREYFDIPFSVWENGRK